MPDPNAEPPELPLPFTAVTITFKDGRTQYGYWNGYQWSSRGDIIDTKAIERWEPKTLSVWTV